MASNSEPSDNERRKFLKLMGVLVIGAGVAGTFRSVVQNVIPSVTNVVSGFPNLTLYLPSGSPVHTSDLNVNDPKIVVFDYPLQNEPNFLLRLGNSSNTDVEVKPSDVTTPANGKKFTSPGGVGPYKSVVSSSAICQHLGCIPPEIHFYSPSSKSYAGKIHCNCHGSTYDPFTGFSVVTGPTRAPLPSVTLSYNSSEDKYSATMMIGPTIYGHSSDLSGGNQISTSGKTTLTTIQ